MYIFDALPILFAMISFVYFWPARFLAIRGEVGSSGGHGLEPMAAPTRASELSAYSEQGGWSNKSSKSYQQV